MTERPRPPLPPDSPHACPMCEGAGRWHRHDGAACYSRECVHDKIRCPVCEGSGRRPDWLR